ncbi:hypothetical protein C7M84_013750 [Penaeus vannamei]|uniref:Uncharacterized protein n=1 Tax=Penaeus vannamei TaxID=6689 RepID=A0A423SV83_PENVA|nr:hypothetical protein C7M84_013750 [Penaeus vannamei]
MQSIKPASDCPLLPFIIEYSFLFAISCRYLFPSSFFILPLYRLFLLFITVVVRSCYLLPCYFPFPSCSVPSLLLPVSIILLSSSTLPFPPPFHLPFLFFLFCFPSSQVSFSISPLLPYIFLSSITPTPFLHSPFFSSLSSPPSPLFLSSFVIAQILSPLPSLLLLFSPLSPLISLFPLFYPYFSLPSLSIFFLSFLSPSSFPLATLFPSFSPHFSLPFTSLFLPFPSFSSHISLSFFLLSLYLPLARPLYLPLPSLFPSSFSSPLSSPLLSPFIPSPLISPILPLPLFLPLSSLPLFLPLLFSLSSLFPFSFPSHHRSSTYLYLLFPSDFQLLKRDFLCLLLSLSPSPPLLLPFPKLCQTSSLFFLFFLPSPHLLKHLSSSLSSPPSLPTLNLNRSFLSFLYPFFIAPSSFLPPFFLIKKMFSFLSPFSIF